MKKKLTKTIFSCSSREVRFSSEVLKELSTFEQNGKQPESGGILLGKVYTHYDEILEITTPGQLDKHGSFFFYRAKKSAQKVINKKWKQSKGELIYLGEWHTHCEKNPTPSLEDKKMIKNMLTTTKMEINYLYLVIVGQDNTYFSARQVTTGFIVLEQLI
ncbi:MAG: Mov34/MPN/PAD-1 family protein [Candidatus Zapsychrus exili]|nr:Mov34/MPN/PAD-1 family protein [Candidatus Zapsychrus exili]